MKKFTIILLTIFALLIPHIALAFDIPERPENGFYDPHSYVSTETKNKLVEFNDKHKSTDHTQLGIAIVDTLHGENIEDVANKISKSWQIGYENSNLGALVLIAINDRKFRIETSNELRKVITDNEALDILNSTKSDMKNQNYDAAVQNIISKIDNEIGKEPTESNQQTENKSSSLGILTPFLILVPLFIISDLQDYKEKRRRIKEEKEFEKRSQFDYSGYDKLYPEDENFNEECWTKTQREDYLKEKRKKEKEDYSRRSAFTYTGNDKLRPGDKNFDDTTWTQSQILMYYSMLSSNDNYSSSSSGSSYSSSSSSSSSSDSSSSWSSSSWSGGGFDGGGSSSGW